MPVIDEMWAWIAEEEEEEEGVIGAYAPVAGIPESEVFHPLVGADKERIESFRDYAEMISENLGVPVRLVKFSNREVLEEL